MCCGRWGEEVGVWLGSYPGRSQEHLGPVGGGGQKWLGSRCILKEDSAGIAEGLAMGMRGALRIITKVVGLSYRKKWNLCLL